MFNQRFRELDGAFAEHLLFGIPPWDPELNYPGTDEDGYAFVGGSDGGIYVALVPSGPATGNPTDPVAPEQTVWRRY